jgi:exopolysaccharide biosynthesis polyprenyl glycosylphosphotransferase
MNTMLPTEPRPIDELPAETAKGGHSRQTARLSLIARLVLGDALSLLIGFSIAKQVRSEEYLAPFGIDMVVFMLPILIVIGINVHAYALDALPNYAESARRALSALVQTFLITFAFLFAVQEGEDTSRVAMGIAFVAIVPTMLLFRLFSNRWVRRALGGQLIDELVILDGVAVPPNKARYVVDARENRLEPDLNDPAMLERFARVTDFYDRIIVACPPERQAAWATLLKTIDAKGELMVGRRDDLGVIGLGQFGNSSTLVVSRGSLSVADRVKKRLFDLAIAIPALIALAPLMIVVAILIKLDSRGPVFFKQPRVGRNNVPFQIYKFRSMRQETCDVAGATSTRRDDDRISRFGAFIRKTSIDELPQLLNVLKGDMSIVGPRPHALGSTAEDRLFWQITHRYWERHALKPGITGLAQVRGYRGATEKASDLTDRLNSDLEYLSGWRLWKDFAIMVATLKVLVHPNAY